jgi:hypothetical protein
MLESTEETGWADRKKIIFLLYKCLKSGTQVRNVLIPVRTYQYYSTSTVLFSTVKLLIIFGLQSNSEKCEHQTPRKPLYYIM